MNASLLGRETGDVSRAAFARYLTNTLLHSFAPNPKHRFDGEHASNAEAEHRPNSLRSHASGVTSLALEKFDGRVLLSGGADGGIKFWDLESCGGPNGTFTFRPNGAIPRAPGESKGLGHSHGITHLDFYPFDPDAFLSSSYDKTLKLWSTRTASLSADFDPNANIYSHSTSPVAEHLLVACATQHANVRLVDLKSGSAVQALVAQGGPVLCASWSPRHGHILASGHADGKVRIWDVRRAGGALAMLDQEDSRGIVQRRAEVVAEGGDGSSMPRYHPTASAHDEAVNGLLWTDDGSYIVSAGMDRRIRVWDAATGANTLASFGSLVQNSHAETAKFFVSPTALSAERGLLFWANDHEIMVFDLHEGNLISRLKSPGLSNPVGTARSRDGGKSRITSMVWRGYGGWSRSMGPVLGGANSFGAIYSAHQDGVIRAWTPRLPGNDDEEDDEAAADEEEARNRKRKAVDDAYKSLMGKRVTFQ